jgi:hypothetical protein
MALLKSDTQKLVGYRISEFANQRNHTFCGFADPRFSDFVRIANQRNIDRVSLIRVCLILSEFRISETTCW